MVNGKEKTNTLIEMKNRGINNFGLDGRLLTIDGNRIPLKAGHVYTLADTAIMEGHSVSKNVHEKILKSGLDYLIESARRGEDTGGKIYDCMARAYNKRFSWSTDYQFNVIYAVKEGKEKKKLEKIA